jgi:hypothetical protein
MGMLTLLDLEKYNYELSSLDLGGLNPSWTYIEQTEQ